MTLRAKVFFLIATVLTLFFSLMIFLITRNITRDFTDLEKREIKKDLNRVVDTLDQNIDNLSIKLGDWAQWDDSYKFITDRNEEYIQSNLQDSTFGLLHIDFVLFFDGEKNIVFQKFVRDGKEEIFPEKLSEHFLGDLKQGEINFQGIHKEISIVGENAVVYSSRPITSSDGMSQPNGVVIFGYIFDTEHITELEKVTHLDISHSLYREASQQDDFTEARNFLSNEKKIFIPETESSSLMSAYVLVDNADNEPSIIFRVDMPREIYQKGQSSILLFTEVFLVTGVVFCGCIFLLLGYFVLNKVAYLHKEIKRIRESGIKQGGIVLPGKDELSFLAKEMNETFQSLYQNEEKQRVQNENLELSKKAILNILEDIAVSEKELKEKTLDLLKFEQATDTSFDHIIITDQDGKVIYANKAAMNITGYSHEEIIGSNPSMWGNQMPKKFYETLWRTIKTEKHSYSGEITNKRKDGKTYLASIRIIPIFDKDGEIQFFVGNERDITEERQSQLRIVRHTAELQESNRLIEEQKNRAESILRFLKSIAEGIIATDQEGKIIFMNEPAELMTLRFFQQVQGKHFNEIFHFIEEKKNEDVPFDVFRLVSEKNYSVSFSQNVFLVQNTEKKLPIFGTASPIRNEKGVVVGAIIVFRDITKLRELDQMKNSFLSVAAHQLRTPLGSMRWTMEMLANGDLGKLPQTAKEAIDQIYENSGRMVVLVNDLLNVSRIDGEKGREEKTSIDLVALVKKVIETMHSEAERRMVKIIFQEPQDLIPEIIVPQKHLYEALENLISNGIKYNKENGTLTLSLKRNENSILLTVTDTGIGIPEIDQKKIFSKFFRAPNAVLKETEGSGLGLSVVKSYLGESGAEVSFQSKENTGTTFFVTFPLHK